MSGVRQQEFSELTSYSSPSLEPQSQAVFDESTETSSPRDRDLLSINLGNIILLGIFSSVRTFQ